MERRLIEFIEARDAAQQALLRIDNAIKSLDEASSLGIWDILGGGFLSSWMKRSRIQAANEDILSIKESLENLNEELEDVNMILPTEVSNTVFDTAIDVWFDNMFTDILVQREMKETLRELKDFRDSIIKLITDLDTVIQNMDKE